MNESKLPPKERAAQFVGALRRVRNDRGKLAALRRGLSPATAMDAWPVVADLGGDMIVLQEPRPRPSRMRSSRSMPDLRPVQRFRSAWPPRTNGSGSKARPKREKSRPNPGMAKPKPTATLYSATCAGIRSGFGVFPWGSPTKRRDRLAAMRPGCDRCWAQPM